MTTNTVATTGWEETAQPAIPSPARPIMQRSATPRPPIPKRIERTRMSVVAAVCTPTRARLQRAPSASCEANAVTPRALQINHVPRCGRVRPRKMSRT
jgi:hypothetical protein